MSNENSNAAPTVTTTFVREKETKHTVKFEEVPEPGQAPIMGAAYVQKHVLHRLGNPERIAIAIVPA